MTNVHAHLGRVTCATADPARLVSVWVAIGATPAVLDDGRLSVPLDGSTLEYVPDTTGRSGITGIEISIDLTFRSRPAGHTHLTGVDVTLANRGRTTRSHVSGPDPAVRLDHVAIVVHDLGAASQAWSQLIGVEAETMPTHPISGGAFGATRFTLGRQMIELLSPIGDRPSSVARRLETHGEGPIAMATPVADMSTVTARLDAARIRILHQPPHVLVHPRDIGGVLVQLTPRLAH